MADLEDVYALFVDTVARNLEMQAEAVRATEAACYRGQAAVAVGFATRLGTWHDLIAHSARPKRHRRPRRTARIRTTSRRQRQRRWYPRPHSRRRQPSPENPAAAGCRGRFQRSTAGARCGIAASPDAAG